MFAANDFLWQFPELPLHFDKLAIFLAVLPFNLENSVKIYDSLCNVQLEPLEKKCAIDNVYKASCITAATARYGCSRCGQVWADASKFSSHVKRLHSELNSVDNEDFHDANAATVEHARRRKTNGLRYFFDRFFKNNTARIGYALTFNQAIEISFLNSGKFSISFSKNFL